VDQQWRVDGIFTLNVMPELWKLKLFMEGIRNGYQTSARSSFLQGILAMFLMADPDCGDLGELLINCALFRQLQYVPPLA
jgi:hypothetical protein